MLVGLGGNDAYVVDGASDHVVESAGGGRDVVYAAASYALAAGQEIEVLSTISQCRHDGDRPHRQRVRQRALRQCRRQRARTAAAAPTI